MGKSDALRKRLQSRLFDRVGKTVTLKKRLPPTYNTRGEIENESFESVSIVIVPYNTVSTRQTYQGFGNLNEGDFDAGIPYDVEISIDDQIILDSITYRVKEIAPHFLPENIVTIVRLSKEQT